MKNNWTENNRTLSATVTGSIVGETVNINTHLSIYVPGEIHHPRANDEGANVSMLIEKNGKYGARLYAPVSVNGKSVAVVGITARQYASCREWMAVAASEIRNQLTSEIESRETIKIQWGGNAGFMGEEFRRGKLIEAHLTLAGIKWTTDWDCHQPHSATLPRAEWKKIETEIQSELDRQNNQIEYAINNPQPAATQLWEPCEKCGAEPSYQTANGHLCRACQ
jgi:hypothetical protein